MSTTTRSLPALVTVTPAAAARISRIVAQSDASAIGLKVGVRGGGCAGFSYDIAVARKEDLDEGTLVEAHGAKLVVDRLAELYLVGTVLDFEETLMESRFVFRNPNAVSQCGCGESIGFG